MTGCGETPPKTLEELYSDERQLPAVFIMAESGEQIIVPGDRGVFVDDATGELCWPALTCDNPNCPARSNGNKPYLFFAADKAVYAKPDGSIGYDHTKVTEADNFFGNCPECLKIRDVESETDEQRQQYSNWARPYVLPETAKRREELAAARQKREAELQERMRRTVD